MELKTKSNELLQHLNTCKERFESVDIKPEKTEALFYDEVKPTFEKIMDQANEWKPLAEALITKQKPKYVHLSQLESTLDNIEQIVLQSFYKDVNKQRFHNLHHSVEYIVNSILTEIEERD